MSEAKEVDSFCMNYRPGEKSHFLLGKRTAKRNTTTRLGDNSIVSGALVCDPGHGRGQFGGAKNDFFQT